MELRIANSSKNTMDKLKIGNHLSFVEYETPILGDKP